MFVPDLIYDIGLNIGNDTASYLRDGYRVIGIEANPWLVEHCRRRFARELSAGRLSILNVGISDSNGMQPFYVNTEHHEWSSFDKRVAWRESEGLVTEVPTMCFEEILALYKPPYYLKSDIEMNDVHVLNALKTLKREDLPQYISVEAVKLDYLVGLYNLGYEKFKIVDQRAHGLKSASGPFGEKASGNWVSFPFAAYEWLHSLMNHQERLEWLKPDSRHVVRLSRQADLVAPMRLLLEAVSGHVRSRPDDAFCHLLSRGLWQTMTFRDLARSGAAYGNLYRRTGLQRGDMVLIALEHSPDLYYSFLGALMGGFIPSFIPFPSEKQDPARYWESHRQFFSRIGLGAIVTYEGNVEPLRQRVAGAAMRILTPQDATEESPQFESVRPEPEDVAFLQHSSGTTGPKKGVQLTYRAVAEQIDSYAKVLRLNGADRIATWLPLYHDMGLIACFILPLTLGLSIVSMDAFEWVRQPSILLEAIDRYRCTHVWLPNFAFHHLCRTAASESMCDLSSMKAYIDCSEPCKPETFDLFIKTFSRCGVRREQLQVSYAMAETVFAATQTQPGENVRVIEVSQDLLARKLEACAPRDGEPVARLLSVGREIPGIEACVVDDEGQALPDGRVGEIALRGRFLFSGYFRDEDQTRKSFCGDWYRTGDTGFRRNGELCIVGRRKELIILYGRNLYANDIEFLCNQVTGVKKGRSVAFGVYNPEAGSEELVVAAETEERDQQRRREIRKGIRQALAEGMSVSARDIRIVDPGWLIKNTAGKIVRGENLQKYLLERA